MTSLTVYADTDAQQVLWQATDPALIRDKLASYGLQFQQWPLHTAQAATPEAILALYQPQISLLQQQQGYQTADVVTLDPTHPQRQELRQKFLAEHQHSEDEVRFFVQGQGLFCFHVHGQVLQLLCCQGDLINVPAGTLHWFDMGSSPSFTAIRLFTDSAGWVAHFSDNPIASHFPQLT